MTNFVDAWDRRTGHRKRVPKHYFDEGNGWLVEGLSRVPVKNGPPKPGVGALKKAAEAAGKKEDS